MNFAENTMENSQAVEIVVISDIHLGTHACKATKLLNYLKQIQPKKIILNGDIIDSWRFSRSYFPKSHLKIVRQFLKFLEKGTELIYITGNHDEVMRNLSGISVLNLKIVNQLELNLNGSKTWIFHGDFYDLIIHRHKWLARLGAALYGLLTITNKLINKLIKTLGRKEVVIYKSLKERINKHPEKLTKFEEKVIASAQKKGCSTVICGHIHKPALKHFKQENQLIQYINCGDWVENCTAAEYANGEWKLVFAEELVPETPFEEPLIFNTKNLYNLLAMEFPLSEAELIQV